MKKPEKFEDFCETLMRPYSSAKQYFEDIILKIDVYHDMTYFYEFYELLDPEKQDTVYCNLQRLYDVTKEGKDDSSKRLTSQCSKLSKFPSVKADMEDEEFISNMNNFMSKFSEIMEEYKTAAERDQKLTILNELLSTAETYMRNRNSVEIGVCESKCKEQSSIIAAIKQTHIQIFYLMIVVSILASIFVGLMLIYISHRIGLKNYINFIDENIWTVLFFPLGTAFFIWLGRKIIKLTKEKPTHLK